MSRPLPRWRDDGVPGLGACLLCALIGVAIGFGSSYLWPWGLAPDPAAEIQARPGWQPRAGEVLTAGKQSAQVHSELLLDLGDGSRLALVLWLRGARTGKQPVRVTGCDGGGGHVEPLDRPDRREPWTAAGDDIHSLIARAACAGALRPFQRAHGRVLVVP